MTSASRIPSRLAARLATSLATALVTLALCGSVAAASAVAATATNTAASNAAAAQAAATSTTAPSLATTSTTPEARTETSAAERRAADSEFEREKLDTSAFDEEAREAEEGSSRDEGSNAGSFGRMALGLVVVIAVIYGIHWLLRRYGQSRLQGFPGTGRTGRTGIIDVVATTPLAQGRSLHLVRVGGELMLVGATDQSITPLGPVSADSLSADLDAGSGGFQSRLDGALGAVPGSTSPRGSRFRRADPTGPDAETEGPGSGGGIFGRVLTNLQMLTAR